ncbi:hypothetical protein MMC13_000010 [Lambiella insularis]|nr:hypothetical protein [Lambiella insularis]
MSLLFYKRPDYVTKSDGPLNLSDCQKYVERAACSRASVPDNLSFENVMEGRTLPPMSLEDFMDYLVYISHDAENLQFYLWLQDYKNRFDALPASEKALSPRWEADRSAPVLNRAKATRAPEKKDHSLELNDMGSLGLKDMGAFYLDGNSSPTSTASRAPSPINSFKGHDFIVSAVSARDEPKWESFSIQPFRHEISLIISHYIQPSSPRELNLSYRDRALVLHTLQHTTHPSAFDPILAVIALTLKSQSHPNFVRWSICNGNKPRVFALRSLGVVVLSLSFLGALLMILSSRSRWWRIFLLLSVYFGIVNLIASYKGLCVLLYRFSDRQLHPWELDPLPATLFHAPASAAHIPYSPSTPSSLSYSPSSKTYDPESAPPSPSTERLAPFGPRNSFAHEAWVQRWRRRGVLRKIFARTTRIRDEGLRVMQNKIVLQAELYGVLISVPLVVAVVACPRGGFY